MKVTLLGYTQDAREMLIMSKKTRLNMHSKLFDEIKNMSEEQKQKEIEYVFGTIGSSWEFVDYTFLIEGVTRAFTHQLVRHRVGVSFAQQSQRTVDCDDFEYLATGGCIGNEDYEDGMDEIKQRYSNLIDAGVNPQDARGILPTNILTNIMMKMNLRSLADMMSTRLCIRAQGEFREVAVELKRLVVEVHPFTEKILNANCVKNGSCSFKNFKECPVKLAGLIHDIAESDSESMKQIISAASEVQPNGERNEKNT